MEYCSRSVSGQTEPIHPGLSETVSKHLKHPYQRPVQPYNRDAFHRVFDYWQSQRCPPLILDSGCGTGFSAHQLAEQHQDHLVVGIDQSLHRLSKGGAGKHGADSGWLSRGNLCLVRADLVDCWRLAAAESLPVAKHFILYPNPWPKKKHLLRRWHGHPVFPDLIRISTTLELRSNWKTYVDEFALALAVPGISETVLQGPMPFLPGPDTFLTPFEKKYALSGQPLYRLRAFGPK
ncbi:MAG: hypothetical protein R3208_06760 [Ketobacteraceae bacterium]|nr:hypothetical protein [Ketobacteraceae bacterium]